LYSESVRTVSSPIEERDMSAPPVKNLIITELYCRHKALLRHLTIKSTEFSNQIS